MQFFSFHVHVCMDMYKTWTPSPWTTPADLVRGLLRGPSPWNTPVDPLFIEDEFYQLG